MTYQDRKNLEKLADLAYRSEVPLFVVGGAIRNHALGIYINDVDLATPFTPAELISSFGEEAKLINSAQAYPVVSFLGFEIASFRKDGVNRSDAVGISLRATMEEDAQRRDFTVNALYSSLDAGVPYALDNEPGWSLDWDDPTGQGNKDLDKGLIRLIGNPEDRLVEDPVRALRAYRFAAQLDFDIEPETKKACDKVLGRVRMKV